MTLGLKALKQLGGGTMGMNSSRKGKGVEGKGEEEKPIEFKEVYRGGLGSDGQLTELVDKTFIVKNVEIQEMGKYGEVAIATIMYDRVEQRRHTFSSVLIRQLKALKEYTDKGKKVKCTLRKVKRYYTLE
jgi:hypothetical protein